MTNVARVSMEHQDGNILAMSSVCTDVEGAEGFSVRGRNHEFLEIVEVEMRWSRHLGPGIGRHVAHIDDLILLEVE